MHKYIPKLFLPCTLCFTLLSGGLSLTPVVHTAQAAQDSAMAGKLYAERNDKYSRDTTDKGYTDSKRYKDSKQYKKNDPSRLHDNRNQEMNTNKGRAKGNKRDDRYYHDGDRKYDGKRDGMRDGNRKYDGKRDGMRDGDRKYDGKYDGKRDGNRKYDDKRDGMRRDDARQTLTDEPALN